MKQFFMPPREKCAFRARVATIHQLILLFSTTKNRERERKDEQTNWGERSD